MKNCNALYRTLLNITILMFLPTYTMDLTQSTIGFPEEEISQKSTSRPRTQETKKITKELIEYKKQKNIKRFKKKYYKFNSRNVRN